MTRQKNVIIEATKKITEAITKDVIKKVNSQPTLMDAAQAYAELRLNSREMFNVVCPKLEWGGVKLDSLEEELLNIRRGIIYAEDGSVIYERDGKGNIKVDSKGNNIPKVDYLYNPVAYVKFNSLESKIRATALSYTQEASMFNGWKKVSTREGKLVDSHTYRVPNDLGNIVEMPRWMVDNNRNVTCSQGLHVGAWDYVRCFSGDTILKVRVHPRDVVSVPTDYNDMKMRSSRYEVAAIVDNQRKVLKAWDGKTEALHVIVGTAGELISQRKREI